MTAPALVAPVAEDIIQRVNEAVFGVLNTEPRIVTLTGRATKNVVPWGNTAFGVVPVIAFMVVVATPLYADGDTWRVVTQFTAVARDQASVNALLHAVRVLLDAPAFAALAAPLDAFAIAHARRPTPFDSAEDVYRGDLDVTLRVYLP